MRSTTFLRIASIITLLNFAGHSLGYPWTPDVGPAAVPVLEAMKSYSFDAIGSTRTYWEFYIGFGIIISVYLLMQTVVLWQISAIAKTEAVRLRPIMVLFFLVCVVNTFLSWKYFFIIPTAMSAANAICLALALATANRSKAA